MYERKLERGGLTGQLSVKVCKVSSLVGPHEIGKDGRKGPMRGIVASFNSHLVGVLEGSDAEDKCVCLTVRYLTFDS